MRTGEVSFYRDCGTVVQVGIVEDPGNHGPGIYAANARLMFEALRDAGEALAVGARVIYETTGWGGLSWIAPESALDSGGDVWVDPEVCAHES